MADQLKKIECCRQCDFPVSRDEKEIVEITCTTGKKARGMVITEEDIRDLPWQGL